VSETGASRRDWLLISLVLATLASLIHWLIGYLAGAHGRRRAEDNVWAAALRVFENPWITYPVRLIYGIGLPAAALFWQGSLTTRGLGLTTAGLLVDPGSAVSWTIVVTVVAAFLLTVGYRIARRLAPESLETRRSVGRAILEALYHEAHWAFYREPFIIAWGIGVGSWLGAIAVAAETVVNPMFWECLHARDAVARRRYLVRAGLLVASAQLFILTQSLLLTLVMHVAVGWLALRWERPSTDLWVATSLRTVSP